MQKYDFEKFVSTRVHSSLGSLEKGIRRSQKELDSSRKRWDMYASVITLVLALLSVYIGLTNFRAAAKDDADIVALQYHITDLQNQLDEKAEIIKEQSIQLDTLQH